jgi:hypothetical protein
MMLVSNPQFAPATLTTFVETTQVAPTILQALGLDPNLLDAVRIEGTPVLPGLNYMYKDPPADREKSTLSLWERVDCASQN